MTQGTIVSTSAGRLSGQEAPNGTVMFRGIPYAAPPIGPLRWMPPEAPANWDGVRLAHAFGAPCPQSVLPGFEKNQFSNAPPPNEDCLYLNVYTPGCDGAKRPVMVWIHGGAFLLGSGSGSEFDGSRLARRGDVVVVTINYRLGGFGFLHLDSPTAGAIPATGNEGMLDQVAALRWVQENIAGFGGDAGNVTIFGQSAGGMSVSTLLVMPYAQGLFHKAISQSPVGSTALDVAHAERVSHTFLANLGLNGSNVEALRRLDADAIVAAAPSPSTLSKGRMRSRFPRPVVDGSIVPVPVLTGVSRGAAATIPLLAGTTRDETPGSRLRAPSHEETAANVQALLPDSLDAGAFMAAFTEARADRLVPTDPGSVAGALATEAVFRVPVTRLLDAQRQHQPAVFHYVFSWTAAVADGSMGAPHHIDCGFVFGTHSSCEEHAQRYGEGPAADALSAAVQDAWVAFARTGNPSCPMLGEWPAYGERRATMILGERTHVLDAPYEAERLAFSKVSDEALSDPGFGPEE